MPYDEAALDQLLAEGERIQPWQDDLYRHLHRHPELSFVEHRTHDRIAAELREIGADEVVEGIGETGLVGVLRSGDGPTVLMRADIDGLPVQELTGLDYASTVTTVSSEGETVPVMHACGHDVHIACLLGAARLLTQRRDLWSGTFVALFQPAEERGGGAVKMVEDALTDRIPRPDVAFAQHVVPRPAGMVNAVVGPAYSQADSIRLTVHGRGGHGSAPHTAIDPAVLASMIVIRLQTIVARETRPGEFAVVTCGRMQVGSKSNIIADRAVLDLNIRSFSAAVHQRIREAIERMVRAECEASGSPRPPTFEYYDQFPITINDEQVANRLREAFERAFGEDYFEDLPVTGSEDFSVIPDAFEIPYCYWNFGGMDPERYRDAEKRGVVAQEIPNNHSPYFGPVMHPTLPAGTKTILVAALEWLGQGTAPVS